jgi:DNA-binding CsgD family transcriptional regulator
MQADDPRCALEMAQRSLQTFWEHGDIASVGGELVNLALAAERVGQPVSAARLLGLASAVREASGLVVTRDAPAESTAYAETRTALGEDAFSAGFAAGAALTPEVGVAEALAIVPAATPEPTRSASPARSGSFGLTPREREVLRQLASGSTTNRDLAEALSISPKTAGNILAKIGVNSRVAAISVAMKERLF